ncbi:MAG: ribonuclease R [Polyangiales bacterium]
MALPHRSRVFELLAQSNRPLHVAEIVARLGAEDTVASALTAMLDDMVFSGTVRAFSGHRYQLAEGVSEVEGTRGPRNVRERTGVFSMNPRGFGFVSSAGTGEADVFISKEAIAGALHGDTVVVRVFRTNAKGPEGEVASIVKRKVKRVPGVLRIKGKSRWLEPDDWRMRQPITLNNASNNANNNASNNVKSSKGGGAAEGEATRALDAPVGKDGDAVIALITRYPERYDEMPEGELLLVLGRPGEPLVEVEKVLAREQIVEGFPGEAVAEARHYGSHLTEEQIRGREDLRPIPLTTIDPFDARDHDDAVYVRRATDQDEGSSEGAAAYVAWIAIADVAAYVREGMALDDEAKRRGCSVYLPDRAIPMLPRELSTHLCSLVAHEDRLCLAVEVILDSMGMPLRHRLVEGVMTNRAKLTYEDVARVLGFTTDEEPTAAARELLPDLKVAWELAGHLRARRMRRGALDFDLPEAKVKLDDLGLCIDVVRSRADPGVKKAYNLIEELMLLANEVVAEDLTGRNAPTVYRVHGAPDETKLDKFAAMAEALGISFDLEDTKEPKALGRFLKVIASHPQAAVLNSLLLRSMKQATYDVINIGHFGLASKAYLHFTSPIRRYPDLVVHRVVHRICQGAKIARDEETMERLRESALMASTAERKAMDVEREVVDLHRALLMRSRLGEMFEGTVTALVGSGVFVALDAPYVDVLVKFESLGSEEYQIDDDGLSAVGRRSGDVVRLGDRMMVRIDDISIERRSVYGARVGGGRGPRDEKKDLRTKPRRGREEPARSNSGRAAIKKNSAKSSKKGATRDTSSGKSAPTRNKKVKRRKR